ncbi:hypothetical protein [Kitasatospora azatica]|uniref:hypothetical protein n=1 Tax=Kitasatospora azatica TaxID=58347 RepID=UPI000569517D|nr:hypothetical protein [Kitasatospora azatica]
MHIGAVGIAVAAASFVQLALTEVVGRSFDGSGSKLLSKEAEKDKEGELDLPPLEQRRKVVIPLIATICALAGDAAAVLTGLASTAIAIIVVGGVCVAEKKAWLCVPLAIFLALSIWALILLSTKLAGAALRNNPDDLPPPRGALRRFGTRVTRLNLLTPYKTTLFAMNLANIVVSALLLG